MIYLDNVTLLGVDCIDIDRLIYAADVSQNGIKFKTVKLLTHFESDDNRVVTIPKINTIEGYSEFMIKQLNDYVDTDFVLVIQYDGFVLNPQQWNSQFLDFDYIGAPAQWGIGNGGFSLRSKKLLRILAEDSHIEIVHPEDYSICRTYKPYLEQKGIHFATSEIAHEFSVENCIWETQFGYHNADISSWDIDLYTDEIKHKKYISYFKEHFVSSSIRLTYIVQFYLEDATYDPIAELIEIYSYIKLKF